MKAKNNDWSKQHEKLHSMLYNYMNKKCMACSYDPYDYVIKICLVFDKNCMACKL